MAFPLKRIGLTLCFWPMAVLAQWTEPVLVDSPSDTVGVNTLSQDWCPFITVDNHLLYFASWRGDPSATNIFVSRWTGTEWGNAVRLPFCQPNLDERNPAVNPTNDTLYFISWAPGWDIFWSFRTGPSDTSWGAPQRMPEPINSSGIEFSVWVTPDGQRLLFSSWRIAANGEDIYECRRDPTTETGWSDPVRLPGEINTGSLQSYPSMGFDTTELFYWTWLPGAPDFRLGVSHWTDSGWSAGMPLPDTINRDAGETTPCISADGSRLYFSSRFGYPVTAGDIWYSDRPSAIDIPNGHRGEVPHFRVYPNPVREGMTIQMAEGIRQVTLYDILGRRISSQVFNGMPQSVYWSFGSVGLHLPSGAYFLVGQDRVNSNALRIQIIR